MRYSGHALLLAFCLFVPAALKAQPSESSITDELRSLRSVPLAQRPAAATKIAAEINTLRPGLPKVKLANTLAHLVTEGDLGHETLQSAAQTLSDALAEFPLPAKGDQPSAAYVELARLVRYENVSSALKDPQVAKADQILATNEAEIEKINFTLKDLSGKQITLSDLRGKVVLVNFWATWCPPCRVEMPSLDAIYTHFQPQGFVLLSISDENAFKVGSFIGPTGYHPPVLLDPGGKVAKQFHIEGIPQSFVFDREGKLVAQSIDMRSQRQLLEMLSKAGLHL